MFRRGRRGGKDKEEHGTETKAHTPVMVSMKRLTTCASETEFMRSPFRRPAGSSHNQQASEPVENERQKKEYESNS